MKNNENETKSSVHRLYLSRDQEIEIGTTDGLELDDLHSTSHIMKPFNSSNHVLLSDNPHHSP